MHLYSFFRSSAAYRLRIALNLKGLSPEMTPIHISRDGGHQHKADYRAVNPQGRVPALVLDDGQVLTQSLAIIEYLDDTVANPPLLPQDPVMKAKVRAVAQIVACDIHPVNNLCVLQYLKNELHQDEATINRWYHHWVLSGFEAIEKMIQPGPFSFGADVTLADVALVPQVFNARRFKVPLDAFPKIVAVEAACLRLPAFDRARPEQQPDAE